MMRVCVTNLMLQWKDPQDISYNSFHCGVIIIEHKQQNLWKEWKGKCPRCLVSGFKTKSKMD